MKKIFLSTLSFSLLLLMVFMVPLKIFAQTTLIHEFTSDATLGSGPETTLLLSDGVFYGTANGGANSEGIVFSINPDGSDFTIIYEFSGGTDDGANPNKSLVISGNTLYGMTNRGGDDNLGTIFSVDTDGSNFTLLHEFAGGVNDGSYPSGSLILIDNKLYSMALNGGDAATGVIFSIDTDGSNFTLLREFAGGADDGETPLGGLINSGTTLYGMTSRGGDNNNGVIFSIEDDGSDFALLHEFDFNSDGSRPIAELTLVGDTLFGMTQEGGADGIGTIFSINTDGSDFALLHEFTGSATDGETPEGSLIYHNEKLYGLTKNGGTDGSGILFSIEADGSDFTVLHSFISGSGDDGYSPQASLTYYNGKVYGTTDSGGDDDSGTIFSYTVDPQESSSSSNNSSQTSSPASTTPATPPGCGDWTPVGKADLFQINRKGSSATLYFAPINDNVKNYHIVYGFTPGDQRFGLLSAPVSQNSNSGVQSITINDLDPKSNYSFSVIPVNGCAVGEWSSWLDSNWRHSITYKFEK